MKKNFDNFLENLSTLVGEEQAKELDETLKAHEEKQAPSFLGNCLNYDEVNRQLTGKKKKKKMPWPVVAIITVIVIFTLFTGGKLVYHFAFEIDQQGDYGVVQASENDTDFHYRIVPPVDYTEYREEIADNVFKIIYTNHENIIVFIESSEEIQIDIEDVTVQSVFIENGHEAFFYEKNGNNLYWQQGGYFFYLFSNDPSLNLIELASTVEKT